MTAPPKYATRLAVCPWCHGLGSIEQVDPPAFRAIRKEAGLSLRDVCAEVGISAAYLSDIELGRRQPAADVRHRLLVAIGAAQEGGG